MVDVLLQSGKIKKMNMRYARIFEKLGKGIIWTGEIKAHEVSEDEKPKRRGRPPKAKEVIEE